MQRGQLIPYTSSYEPASNAIDAQPNSRNRNENKVIGGNCQMRKKFECKC